MSFNRRPRILGPQGQPVNPNDLGPIQHFARMLGRMAKAGVPLIGIFVFKSGDVPQGTCVETPGLSSADVSRGLLEMLVSLRMRGATREKIEHLVATANDKADEILAAAEGGGEGPSEPSHPLP